MAHELSTSVPFEFLDRYGRSTTGSGFQTSGLSTDKTFCGELYQDALRRLRESPDESIALYVHVPFCHVRCLYCACDTTITHSEEKVDQYLDTLETEFAMITGVIGRGRLVEQLHVGGGTPNHLSEPQLARLMEIVERHFKLVPDACASIECNPRRASASQLDLLHGLGFRRISFGVQDLDADVQRAIGRVHSLNMVRDVYLTARETGFENISFDLVYGLPFQTARTFQETLDRVVELGPDRIACFSYNHDPAKRPHQHAISSHHLPSAVAKLELFQQAVKTFSDAGYRWVGLDVFARDSDELTNGQSEGRLYRTAIGYAPLPAKQVLAFGPSGIGEVSGALVQNESNLKLWQRRIEAGELPIFAGRRLSAQDIRRREALVYLMCNMQLPASSAAELDRESNFLFRNAEHGLLEVTDEGIRVTPEGRYKLHGICAEQDALIDWGSAQWHSTPLS